MHAGNDISAQFCYNGARYQPEVKQVDRRSLMGWRIDALRVAYG